MACDKNICNKYVCPFQHLNLHVVDDAIPETVELFHVRLLNTLSDDNVVGSTNTSGASVDQNKSISTIIVEENDFPYGLLQFRAGNASHVAAGLIVPATEVPQVSFCYSI